MALLGNKENKKVQKKKILEQVMLGQDIIFCIIFFTLFQLGFVSVNFV